MLRAGQLIRAASTRWRSRHRRHRTSSPHIFRGFAYQHPRPRAISKAREEKSSSHGSTRHELLVEEGNEIGVAFILRARCLGGLIRRLSRASHQSSQSESRAILFASYDP